MPEEHAPNRNGRSATLLTVVVVVAVLYFAREVLIPLALAVLLSFLLAPLAIRLRRLKLGRIPSSIIVVLLACCVLVVIGSVMASQMADLGRKLPEYQQNIEQKVQKLRTSGGGLINRITRVTHRFTDDLLPQPAPTGNQEKPVPVEIRRAFSPVQIVQKVLGSVLSVALTTAMVLVFTVFMLIQREDLRDRMLRLVGAGRVNRATQALDEAAHRVSRYLLAQLVVNVCFGALAGVGLYFIGIPNPFLWGLLSALCRYVPYLGIWIAAAFPAALAFAVEPGWLKVPLIFGVYGGIDLLMYNFAEPYLYGTSTGISPVAILVAALFWTWLWGTIGLLLAVPLTVCVAVIGRYVPRLDFLSILLSDEPVLSLDMKFYQRLLAMDVEEATGVAEEFLKEGTIEDLDDQVILPALSLAEQERHRGRLEERRQKFIYQNARMLVEDLAERQDRERTSEKNDGAASPSPEQVQPIVVCIPARDEADEIAAVMLEQLLTARGVPARALSCEALAGECLQEIARERPAIACVAVVPPFGYMHARYMCRRLRADFPDLKVVAAVLTEREVEELRQRQPKLQADELASSLKQALAAILSLLPAKENGNGVRPALQTT